jgi:hypothetical protein
MPLALTLAILAAGQPVDGPTANYGFLWALADGCYEQEGPRLLETRRLCLRREGDILRMADYRRHPRFDEQSDCTARMGSDRLVHFTCDGRNTGDSERTGRFEGETLVFTRSYIQPRMQVRELWRRTANGIEIEIQAPNRDGQWRPFGNPSLLTGWNHWRLTRTDARMNDADE